MMNTVHFTAEKIDAFEQRFKTTFINSLWGFKMPTLIGTVSNEGNYNLAIFNSLFHVGATHSLFGLVCRPNSVERHTLQNIIHNKIFTVNYVHNQIVKQAHQTSARYLKHESEFDETKLTTQFENNCIAPFVLESKVKFAAELQEVIPVKTNNTVLLISKILHLHIPETVVQPDGFIDLQKLQIVASTGLDCYYTTNKIARYSYAKPHSIVHEI
jgi:flavin reductase (DIM6/NTAB) family NADH-FMN oxidoreductase RutF